jgi:hypothetical protein
VFDTGREVVPHEILWNAIQEAFAKDGHLRLTYPEDADAFVRIHLKSASVIPSGEARPRGIERDPKVFQLGEDPPKPTEYTRLPLANRFRESSTVALTAYVEIWDLQKQEVLYSRTYSQALSFRNFGGRRTNDHLRAEEAMSADFKTASQLIARDIVNDFLIR